MNDSIVIFACLPIFCWVNKNQETQDNNLSMVTQRVVMRAKQALFSLNDLEISSLKYIYYFVSETYHVDAFKN